MEFVTYNEAITLLHDQGVREIPDANGHLFFEMPSDDETVFLHVSCADCQVEPREGARTLSVEKARLADLIENILHKLHLNQIVLIPVGKWRSVFDAVAFSLASNEDWQEIDAAATVELNTRDPLLCEPGDFNTLNALIAALLNDAESPEQGLTLATPSAPLMVEVVPDGAVRISVGNPVLADEVIEAFDS